jgi:ATP-dependent DNA helicase RecQ
MPAGDRALRLLREAYGREAKFREGQAESIAATLEPASRTLVVQRTGWGKSLVYFIACRVLCEEGEGPTLLVSPLLSLMRSQSDIATLLGVRAVALNSTNADEWSAIEAGVKSGEIDLLMVSPERLGNSRFVRGLLPFIEKTCSLVVVDEAHCISDWGHDFRPDYRRILPTIQRLGPKARVLGTTATANDRVIEDVRTQLGDRLTVLRGPLMRESLKLRAFRLGDRAERLAFLAKYLPRFRGSGIVYTLTVNDARRVAEWLQGHDIDARAYHADLPNEVRVSLEEKFQANDIKALCATTALGMGYDKSDVSFVVHFQRPGSVIAYYQQVGRAGRGIDTAEVVLLEGAEDDDINEYFIESAFPGAEVFEQVKGALGRSDPMSVDQVTAKTNCRRGQVEKALKLMEVEGATGYDRGHLLLDPGWSYERLRSDEVTDARRRELQQMQEYGSHQGCRMEFLARALDDANPGRCGRCDGCSGRKEVELPRALVAEAIAFLRSDSQVIESKAFFPPGALAPGRKKIPKDERLDPGVALSVYGDAGWGALVKQGKYETGRYADELLDPSAAAVRKRCPPIDWLTWVPSSSHPNTLPDFAVRLAAALGVPAIDCVRRTKPGGPQKTMQNSSTQWGNAWDCFTVESERVRSGACLLVDDIVDSGWTLTAIGVRLRRAGSGPVVPFALATSRPRDDR